MREVWERQQAWWAEHCHPAGDLGLSLAEFRSSSSLLPSNVQVGDEADVSVGLSQLRALRWSDTGREALERAEAIANR